jgi:hypothetical protein
MNNIILIKKLPPVIDSDSAVKIRLAYKEPSTGKYYLNKDYTGKALKKPPEHLARGIYAVRPEFEKQRSEYVKHKIACSMLLAELQIPFWMLKFIMLSFSYAGKDLSPDCMNDLGELERAIIYLLKHLLSHSSFTFRLDQIIHKVTNEYDEAKANNDDLNAFGVIGAKLALWNIIKHLINTRELKIFERSIILSDKNRDGYIAERDGSERIEKEVNKLVFSFGFEWRLLDKLSAAIKEKLEKSPNNVCKRDILIEEDSKVMREELKIPSHISFKNKFLSTLSSLSKLKKIDQYFVFSDNEKHVFVRLLDSKTIKTYESAHFIRNQISESPIFETAEKDEFIKPDNFNDFKYEEGAIDKAYKIEGQNSDGHTNTKLPDLPEIVDPEFHANQKDQYTCEDEFEHDQETNDLFDVLTNKGSQNNNLSKNRENESEDIKDPGSLLEYLKLNLEKKYGFEVNNDSFNTLRITVNNSSSPLEIEIKSHPEFKRISIKSYFEYIRERVTKLLKLAGRDDFSSTIGIIETDGKQLFVIKKTLSTLQITPKRVSEMIFQSLSEIVQINEIISDHKRHNSN